MEVPRVDENGAVKGVHRVAMKPETVERLLKTLEEELWLARDGGQCTFGPRPVAPHLAARVVRVRRASAAPSL